MLNFRPVLIGQQPFIDCIRSVEAVQARGQILRDLRNEPLTDDEIEVARQIVLCGFVDDRQAIALVLAARQGRQEPSGAA